MTLHSNNTPADTIEENLSHQFPLISGTFNASDGGYLVLQLLHQKIDFLTLKSLSKKDFTEGANDVIHYLQRLSAQADAVRDLILVANSQGKDISIKCDITIDIV